MSKNFDPSFGCDDEHIAAQNGELYDALIKELKKQSTNRWHYDQIDYCWTGKDADLAAWGYQGLHVDSIDDEWITATVHTGKTVCGDDVCMNLPENLSDEDYDKARELYLEQAFEVVTGCGCAGEWSGDDWFLAETYPIKIKTPLSPTTGKLGAKRAVAMLYKAAQKALEGWDREMGYVAKAIESLAGWRDAQGNPLKEGEVIEDRGQLAIC